MNPKYKDIQKKYKKFCPHLWQHFSMETNGEVKFCCEAIQLESNFHDTSLKEIFNNDEYNKKRQQLLDGVEIPECHQCWYKENQGLKSKRLLDMEFVRDDFVERFEKWQSGEEIIPDYYNIQASNTCNFACIMCSPVWSSSLYSLTKDSKNKPSRFDSDVYKERNNLSQNPNFWKGLQEVDHKLNRLYLTGGEPFMVKELWHYIETLVERDLAKNIDFWCSTNASMITEKQLKLLSNFNFVDLNLSIDGYGEVNEYLRFKSNWTNLDNQISILAKKAQESHNFMIGIVPVVSALSIESLPRLIKWYCNKFDDKSQVHVKPITLHWPKTMHLNSLPKKIVNETYPKIQKSVETLKSYLPDDNPRELSNQEKLWENILTGLELHKFDSYHNQLLKQELEYFSKIYKKDYVEFFNHILT